MLTTCVDTIPTLYVFGFEIPISFIFSFYYSCYLFNSDVDECEEDTDGCSQTCTNTNGSFICGCNSGFLLDVNGATCSGMQKQFLAFIYTYNTSNLKYNRYIIINVHPGTLCTDIRT